MEWPSLGLADQICKQEGKIMLIRKHMGNTLFLINGKAYANLRGWI